jgi:hypothetical protein
MTDTPGTAEAAASAETGQNAPASAIAPVARAVIALPMPEQRWAGRILTHAPGPAETARVLHEILATRFKGRDRTLRAAAELVDEHPAGWEYLRPPPGTAAARTRRRETPLGRCRCHQDDGTPRPGLLDAQRRALRDAEWGRSHRPEPGPGTDGAPWLITNAWGLPDDIAHLFLIDADHINLYARDKSADTHFSRAAQIPMPTQAARVWARPPIDWEQLAPELDEASARIRARPRRDWERAAAARTLAETATRLARIAPHADLVLYLLGGGTPTETGTGAPVCEAALAAAADVHSADLPALLLRAPRSEQIRLLKLAAHQLDPDKHRAP